MLGDDIPARMLWFMTRCVVTSSASLIALLGAPLLLAQQPAQSRPTSLEYCYQDQFALAPGPYQRARPAPGAAPARIDAEDSCISGDLGTCKRRPLEPASAWIAGARLGDWICVSDGTQSGWVPASELKLEPTPERPIADWRGKWKRDAGDATVTIRARDDRMLDVSGDAQWSSGPDAVPNVGQLTGRAKPSGIELLLGDPRCVGPDRADKADAIPACLECNARLLLVGTTLIVTDNRNCGGLNVNFDGLYHR